MFKQNPEGEMHTVNPNLNSVSGGFAFSATAVVYIAFSVILGMILSAIAGYLLVIGDFNDVTEVLSYIQTSKAYLYVSFLVAPIVFAISAFSVLKFKKIAFREVFPVKCHPKYYIIAVMVIAGLFLALNQINELFMQLIGKEEGETYKILNEFISTLSGWDIPLAFLTFAILPAFFEELMFRGIMLNTTEQSMGTVRAILVTGFCFSIFHGAIEQSIYQFLAGCLFAFVAARSGSILPSMLMHFINNAIVVLLGACGAYNSMATMPDWLNILLICIGACCLIGGVIWLILDKKPVKRCRQGGVKNFFLWASVGIAIMGITIIISLF